MNLDQRLSKLLQRLKEEDGVDEFPNIFFFKEYVVWCRDEVLDDVLWDVVQETTDRAEKFEGEYKGIPYTSFQLYSDRGYASFANIKNETMVCEADEKARFLAEWEKVPDTCFLIDVTDDEAAALAITFVKNLQKRYSKTAFEYSIDNPNSIIFDENIQKMNFISQDTHALWHRSEQKLPTYPNIGYGERYYIWCLDELSPDTLWEVVQGTEGVSERIDGESEGEAYVRFNLYNDRGSISFAVWVKNRPVCDSDEERVYFQNAWFAIPKSFFIIENGEEEESAALAIAFVKNLQKRHPRTAFEYYSGFPDYMVFENDIQKLNFVRTGKVPDADIQTPPGTHLWRENLSRLEEDELAFVPPATCIETDDRMVIVSQSKGGLDETMRQYDLINKQTYGGRKKLVLVAPHYADAESIAYLRDELGVLILRDASELFSI